MKHLLLIAALFITSKTISCTCAGVADFCQVISDGDWQTHPGHVVVFTKVIEISNTGIQFQVLASITGQAPATEIIRMGHYASLCELGLDQFSVGDQLIMAVFPDEEQVYHFPSCSNAYLTIFEDRIEGAISPGISRIYRSDLEQLNECGSILAALARVDTGLKVFPILTPGPVTISIDAAYEDLPLSFRVFNSAGQLVQQGKKEADAVAGPLHLDLSPLSNGLYFIELKTTVGKRRTFKVVKQ